jgi:hypothetical protein
VNKKLLSIYLNDHLMGATVGVELARRAHGNNRGNEFDGSLAKLAQEIAEDRETLIELMDRLGIGRDRPKIAAGWVAEKAGRLKLNGSLRGYSPLSRMVELEGLSLGVEGKLAMWRVLKETVAEDGRPAGIDLDALIERAMAQRQVLEELRGRAARIALAG